MRGLDTWALMLDLCKALDRVDREPMWLILAKFGAPPKLVRLIKNLYDGSTLEMKVEGANIEPIPSGTGVKQGCNLSPTLFLFVFQAAFEGMQWPDGCEPLNFRYSQDGVLRGRHIVRTEKRDAQNIRHGQESTVSDLEMRESLYADDAGLLFGSLEAWQKGVVAIRNRLAQFGLEMHYAHPGEKLEDSKTIGIFFPALPRVAAGGQPVGLLDEFTVGSRVYTEGRVPWVTSFKYLGCILSSDLSDVPNVVARVKAASRAYGALSSILRNKDIRMRVRARLYQQLALPALLRGSECWRLSAESKRRLATLHHGCCRKIVGVSKWRQWKRRVKTGTIAEIMGSEPIEFYIAQRFVKWLGHLARMSEDRLPKKLLLAWPKGGQAQAPHPKGPYHPRLLRSPGGMTRGCFSMCAHKTICFMQSAVRMARSTNIAAKAITAKFQTIVGAEDEPLQERAEGYYGSTEWKRWYKRRIARSGITWIVGKAEAEGCMDWAPTASWMDVANDRNMWRTATEILLTNERYWVEVA